MCVGPQGRGGRRKDVFLVGSTDPPTSFFFFAPNVCNGKVRLGLSRGNGSLIAVLLLFPSFLSLRRGYYCEGEGEEEVEKPLFPSSRKEVRRKGKACVVLWLLAGGVTKGRRGEVRPRCEKAEGSLSRPNPVSKGRRLSPHIPLFFWSVLKHCTAYLT